MPARVKLPELSVHEHSTIIKALMEKIDALWNTIDATDKNTIDGRREVAAMKSDARFIKELIERIS